MNKQTYRVLKEINSLYRQIKNFESDMGSENSRLAKILKMRELRSEELSLNLEKFSKLKMEITQLENDSNLIANKIEQSKSSLNQIFTEKEQNALESQIKAYEDELSTLEESYFENSDKLESLKGEIEDANSFLAGSLETLEEIKDEINSANSPRTNEIKILKHRLHLLQEEIPANVSERLLKLLGLNLHHGPFCYVKSSSCSICGYSLSQLEAREIDKNLKFSTCKACERIFISESVNFD